MIQRGPWETEWSRLREARPLRLGKSLNRAQPPALPPEFVHYRARKRQILHATDKIAKPNLLKCCCARVLLGLKELTDQPRKYREVASAKRDSRDPIRERSFKRLIEAPDAQNVQALRFITE